LQLVRHSARSFSSLPQECDLSTFIENGASIVYFHEGKSLRKIATTT
jgi:hypothetical protein